VKIVHVTTVDMSLRFLLLAQLEAAVAEGHEVVAVSAAGPHVPFLEARGIRHIALKDSTRAMSPTADFRCARQLWRILRDERPDVIHTHNPKPGLYGRVVGRLVGVPIVVNTVHGLYATPLDARGRRTFIYLLEAIASRFSHAELVQNPEDLELLGRLHLTPRRKLHLLGNGVDLRRFRPGSLDPVDRERNRSELGIAPGEVVVGTVGRLVLEKGYLELFAAAEKLPAKARLVVVGPADPEKSDEVPSPAIQTAERRGVVFLGHRDDVERVYPLFDVFVLASHREGFPRAAMEAAASGLPIVGTNIRGCRQVVWEGHNGYLVPAKDPGRLVEAITALANDAELRQRMSIASRAKAEAEFDERVVVDTVLSTYARLSRQRDRRPALVKRSIDVVLASVALIALSPVIAIVALIVRLWLGRPVLFKQERPGLDGEPFTIIKFRTMRDARDSNGQPLPDDARLTAVGRVLRKWSLDELPELVNVLRAEMSVVGPRPLLPEYLPRYSPSHARRHHVRPGITGWAQVNGRNLTTWAERLDMDVWYVDNFSLRLDLRILLKTLRVVFARAGISHDGHATMPHLPDVDDRSDDPLSWRIEAGLDREDAS
jgi:lipopolysaccharide/colanic/teichoic acid biosynthesis glycosyltransferase